MGNDIVIVGNGPSVVDEQLGPVIDSFTHVVRFNGYVIDGFEDHVGTKTTIWSRWYGLSTMQPMDDLASIWINMPPHERTDEKLEKALALLGEYRGKAEVIPDLEVAVGVQRAMFGGTHPTKWPSSGILAIAHALHRGYDVSIVGIDSWSKEPFHYYGPHDRTHTHHVAEVERAYIDRVGTRELAGLERAYSAALAGSGRVKILSGST